MKGWNSVFRGQILMLNHRYPWSDTTLLHHWYQLLLLTSSLVFHTLLFTVCFLSREGAVCENQQIQHYAPSSLPLQMACLCAMQDPNNIPYYNNQIKYSLNYKLKSTCKGWTASWWRGWVCLCLTSYSGKKMEVLWKQCDVTHCWEKEEEEAGVLCEAHGCNAQRAFVSACPQRYFYILGIYSYLYSIWLYDYK